MNMLENRKSNPFFILEMTKHFYPIKTLLELFLRISEFNWTEKIMLEIKLFIYEFKLPIGVDFKFLRKSQGVVIYQVQD